MVRAQEVIISASASRQGPPVSSTCAAAGKMQHPSRTSSGLAANCGVFVGISYNEYIGMAAAHNGVSTYTATGGSLSVAAGSPFRLQIIYNTLAWRHYVGMTDFKIRSVPKNIQVRMSRYAMSQEQTG